MPEPGRALGPPAGCTIATRRLLPAAKVLAGSYLEHHPGHEFVIALIDAVPDSDDRPGYRVVDAATLVVDEDDYLRMVTAYTAAELSNALKPLLLQRLVERYRVVVYLDPQMLVCAPFPDVVQRAADQHIVIAPRLLAPIPADGKEPDEQALGRAGMFEQGFIAAGQGAKTFLDFWGEQARRGPVGAAEAVRYSEPPWLDRIPALFQHEVLADPGFGVGYWNVHERPLATRCDATITAAGEPLRLFHFSGHSPEQPWLLSVDCADRPRIRLSEHPVLRALCASYRERLHSAGYQTSVPYGYDSLPDGTRLTRPMRQLFRSEWMRAVHGDRHDPYGHRPAAVPPHPFTDDGGAAFKRWLNSPATIRERAAGMNRLAMWPWQTRTDLQATFPEPLGANAAGYRQWCGTHGVTEGVPPWAVPVEPRPVSGPEDRFGVNIAGFLTAELGLGEMARIVHRIAERAGIPVASVVEEQSIACRTALPQPETAGRPRYPVSILAVNADYTDLVLSSHPEVGHNRHRIGLWAWELEDFPAWMHPAFHLVDEVWTSSEFSRTAIARHSPVPVRVLPVPVLDPGVPRPRERRPGDPVQFFFAFDFNSTAQRKNPWGLVTAFQRAFPGRRDVRLVIKTTNDQLHTAAAERLRMHVGSDDRIELVERYLTVAELHDLYDRSDAYVSLHRSEGFGLTVAEAMVRAKPVIATDYSSTTEFFDDSVGWPIPYRMVEVGPGWQPYQADGYWADPDLDAAARAMREVADDPAEASRRGLAAREHILRTRSVAAAADWMAARIDDAYRAWRADPAARATAAGSPLSLDQAGMAVHRRADVRAPSRFPFVPQLRRAVLRLLDHYDANQRRVLSTVVDDVRTALHHLDRRIERLEHLRREGEGGG
jgi:glycosyltransferase involved in cell wall biosynthesis